jgi:hypothetical protein
VQRVSSVPCKNGGLAWMRVDPAWAEVYLRATNASMTAAIVSMFDSVRGRSRARQAEGVEPLFAHGGATT